MVNPAGTGKPILVISARPAPLPPRRSRQVPSPSALPAPKEYIHLLTVRLACPFLELWSCCCHRSQALAGKDGRHADCEILQVIPEIASVSLRRQFQKNQRPW